MKIPFSIGCRLAPENSLVIVPQKSLPCNPLYDKVLKMKANFDFGNRFYLFYNNLLTASRSKKEVRFMQKLISSYDSKILDFGFGWARHLKAFAELGYKNLTGIDSSEKLLEKAKNELKKHPSVRLVKADFVRFRSNKKYDFIFQVFQSFGYDTKLYDEKNLENINKLLSNKGVYLLDLRNPIWLLGGEAFDLPSFAKIHAEVDLKNIRLKYQFNLKGIKDAAACNIYTFKELKKMFKNAGLKIIKTFGDFKGNKYSAESERLILVAKKVN